MENQGNLRFRISNVDVSLANSIRRTILSDIPSFVLDADNKCSVDVNTSRQHNEILKHRLTCIPVHLPVTTRDEMEHYVMEVDVKNETDNYLYVTTEHFQIKDRRTDQYLEDARVKEIFPKCDLTNSYILFARLRPRISDTIPGEHLRLSCEFAVGTSKDSSAYTAVSTCSYMYTINMKNGMDAWKEIETKLESEKVSKEDIQYQRMNFLALDLQRYPVENSFDFVIESVGVYTNRQIVYAGIDILKRNFQKLMAQVEADEVPIMLSVNTMENCYDVTIEEGDYTIGPVLQYFITEMFFKDAKTVNYCGFKQFHPHNTDSTLRIAFKSRSGRSDALYVMKQACKLAIEFYTELHKIKI
jgi:DNA-directed RNA polymerase II subunit RPB3